MRKLGISIYPDKSSEEEIFNYLNVMKKLGASRIFSCLLSISKNGIEKFKEINKRAKSLGYEIIVDVNPEIFKLFNIDYMNLEFFKEIYCDGIRLDLGFDGAKEALMTYNKENLKIEFNMSNDVSYIDNIMNYKPNRFNIIASHNFYPHKYTGLTLEHFKKCNKRFKKYGIRTAAFVGLKNDNAFGGWDISEGLVTLESHRDLDVDIQMKHLIAMDEVDDIIISNCFPNDEELRKLSKVNLNILNLDVELYINISEIERKLIFFELHFNRGDVNEFLIRSTNGRIKYKNEYFKLNNQVDIKRGDIIIESSEYGRYAGEVQIALKDMKNSGKSSVIGRVVEKEHFILDEIKPWQKFIFTESKK